MVLITVVIPTVLTTIFFSFSTLNSGKLKILPTPSAGSCRHSKFYVTWWFIRWRNLHKCSILMDQLSFSLLKCVLWEASLTKLMVYRSSSKTPPSQASHFRLENVCSTTLGGSCTIAVLHNTHLTKKTGCKWDDHPPSNLYNQPKITSRCWIRFFVWVVSLWLNWINGIVIVSYQYTYE